MEFLYFPSIVVRAAIEGVKQIDGLPKEAIDIVKIGESIGVASLLLTMLWITIRFVKKQIEEKETILKDQIIELNKQISIKDSYIQKVNDKNTELVKEVSVILDRVFESNKTSEENIKSLISNESNLIRLHLDSKF